MFYSKPTKPAFNSSVVGVLFTALTLCLFPACYPDPSYDQPSSPLSPEQTARLATNDWYLVAVEHRGENVAHASLDPLRFLFTEDGGLEVHAFECGGAAYFIYFLDDDQFRLGHKDSTAVDCGEPRMSESSNVEKALEATNTIKFDNGILVLSGDEAA